jgi:hypothetical protein
MKATLSGLVSVAAIAAASLAEAAADVVLGDIDDLTGVYSDNGGPGAEEAFGSSTGLCPLAPK